VRSALVRAKLEARTSHVQSGFFCSNIIVHYRQLSDTFRGDVDSSVVAKFRENRPCGNWQVSSRFAEKKQKADYAGLGTNQTFTLGLTPTLPIIDPNRNPYFNPNAAFVFLRSPLLQAAVSHRRHETVRRYDRYVWYEWMH